MKAGIPHACGSSLPPGTTVGHYEILAEIGHGGMGVVYLARDRNLGRKVALKCPAPERATDPEARQRFLRECRALSSIDHPHVVTVFEGFEHDGLPWLAMALVQGSSLRDRLAEQGPFSLEEALQHAVSLAGALHAAHERGVLHRDINPNNVMIADDGRALLADFGLARVWEPPDGKSEAPTEPQDLTRPGKFFGTPGYMSPEQALGKVVDPRSDIYSLGLVLLEMCTGRKRDEDSSADQVTRTIREQQPAASPRVSREITPGLVQVLHRATATQPQERQGDAAELHRELDELRRRLEVFEYEDEHPPPPDTRTIRRHRLGHAVLSLALLGLAVAWAAYEIFKERGRLPDATPRQVTTAVGWEAEPVLSPDGTLLAYVGADGGDPDIWIIDVNDGRPVRLTDDPAPDRSPAWLPDGGSLVYVSTRQGRDSIWKVPRLGGSPTLLVEDGIDPAISPDGERIAFSRLGAGGEGLRIFVAPLADPADAVQLTHEEDGLWDHLDPAWSADGRTICYADFRNLWTVPAAGGRAAQLTSDDGGDFHPVWSRDGRFVYFASHREATLALWRMPVPGGKPERITTGTGPETEPSLAPDGARLAYSTVHDDPDLVFVDLASGERVKVSDARVETAPAVAPDGRTVVFVSDRRAGRYELWRQALVGGRPVGPPRRLTDHPGAASHPSYSADGDWIAYQRTVDGERDIWIVPARGGTSTPFTSEPGPDIHPAWSPQGGRIAFVSERDGRSRIWVAPVRDGRPVGAPYPLTDAPDSNDLTPAWSPDGGRIAFVCAGGGTPEVCVAPAAGGEQPRVLTSGAGARRVRWDAFSGRLFVSGKWGSDTMTLRAISSDGRGASPVQPPVVFGQGDPFGDFDLSPDGSLLVFTQEERRGDIWVLEANTGSY